MHVLYNGVYLEVQRVLRRDLTYVFDPSDQDYLYERHVLDVIAVYHANRTSYEYDPATRKLVPTPGVSPGLTDVALRSAIGEPRKPLHVYSGDDLVLAAPRPGQVVDANNGPKPLKHDIVEVLGRHTYLVRFQVEACVRECPPDSPLPQFILSSRYETSHDVDPQHRTVVTTSGVTLFRSDLLEANKLHPDHFRSQVIPPIPKGFRRLAIKVTSKPARNALVWRVVDREEFEHVGDPYVRNAKGKSDNPWGLVNFQCVMTGATMGVKEAAASTHALQSISGVAVGNKSSSRYKLLQFCMSVAMSKCKVGLDGVVLRHLEIASHLHERTVQLQCVGRMPEAKPGKPKGLSGISALFSVVWKYVMIIETAGASMHLKCVSKPYLQRDSLHAGRYDVDPVPRILRSRGLRPGRWQCRLWSGRGPGEGRAGRAGQACDQPRGDAAHGLRDVPGCQRLDERQG